MTYDLQDRQCRNCLLYTSRGDMMSLSDVTDILAVNIIGAVPDDENIVISTNQGAVSYTHLDVYKRQAETPPPAEQTYCSPNA